MVGHEETIKIIRDNIKRDSRIPDDVSYILHEVNQSGTDANTPLPVIELTIEDISRDDPSNTTLSGYVYDGNGNKVGRRYQDMWEMQLFINVWAVDGSDANADELISLVQEVLFDFDEHGAEKPFKYEDGEPVDEIWNFRYQGMNRNDNFSESPAVRRQGLTTIVQGYEEYRQTGEDSVLTTKQNTSTN